MHSTSGNNDQMKATEFHKPRCFYVRKENEKRRKNGRVLSSNCFSLGQGAANKEERMFLWIGTKVEKCV